MSSSECALLYQRLLASISQNPYIRIRIYSDHHLLLLRPLLLFHFAQASSVEPLETAKDKRGVIGAANLLVDGLK